MLSRRHESRSGVEVVCLRSFLSVKKAVKVAYIRCIAEQAEVVDFQAWIDFTQIALRYEGPISLDALQASI